MRWGMALIEGRAVTQDPVEGESWLRRAALAGDAEAAAMVGDLYARNGGGLPPNYAEAACLVPPRRRGRAQDAARALGFAVSDRSRAWRTTTRRRRDGCVSRPRQATKPRKSISPISCCREQAVPKTPAESRGWFREGAASGDLVAAFNFGMCLGERRRRRAGRPAGRAMAAPRRRRRRRTRNTSYGRMLVEWTWRAARSRGGALTGSRGPRRPAWLTLRSRLPK